MRKLTRILKPLKRVSPSRYTAINKCPYKVVLANSYPFPLLPYPPNSHLGNIIHASIKLIIIGAIKTPEKFDEEWNRLLHKEEKVLNEMGFGFFIPLSDSVPGYTIKKLQVKSLIKCRIKMELPERRNTDIKIMTEKWLESKDSLIAGSADIIVNVNSYVKLWDFKTGKILLEGEVIEDYKDQLKLYAYLYNEVFCKYPNEISIIDIENRTYPIAFTSYECEALANRSRDLLSEINVYIKKNELNRLAQPSIANCKTCLYRPACDFYWDISPSETNSFIQDIQGYILLVHQFQNGNLNVTLNRNNMRITISQINSEFLPVLTSLIGKKVIFFNVKIVSPAAFHAIKTTTVYESNRKDR